MGGYGRSTGAIPLDFFNAKRDFGAVGDGVTNDTTALQNAINAAIAAGAGLYIPAGTYKITAVLIASSAVFIFGAGRTATIITATAAGSSGFQPATGSHLADLCLRGPNVLSTGFSGVNGAADDVLIENCIIEKWGDHNINTGGSSNRWIIRNNIIRNAIHGGILIAQGSSKCIVEGNEVYSNGSNGIDMGGASFCTIHGNVVRLNGGAGGPVDVWGILVAGISTAPAADGMYNTITGNIVDANAGQGIIVRADAGQKASFNTISGNIVTNNTGSSGNGDGISIDGSSAGTMQYNIVSNNIVDSNQRYGIVTDGSVGTCQYNSIIGNITTRNGQYGLITSSSFSRFVDNISRQNVTADYLDGGTGTVREGTQTLGATPGDPTGTASTTGVMMGLAQLFTPRVTGRLAILITGNLTNSTAAAGDGAKAQIRWGTGGAPANAAALTGTAVGNIVSSVLERATASDLQSFACVALVTGLTLETQVWIDISVAAIVGGTGQAKNISVMAFEV